MTPVFRSTGRDGTPLPENPGRALIVQSAPTQGGSEMDLLTREDEIRNAYLTGLRNMHALEMSAIELTELRVPVDRDHGFRLIVIAQSGRS